MNTDRIIFFDYLRFFAITAVIILHVSCEQMRSLDALSFEWNALNFYNGMVRWGVPVFIMISGYLFLSRNIEIRKLYSKYILRLFVGFVIWSLLYTIFFVYKNGLLGVDLAIRDIIGHFIVGEFHMWFIPMIIGLYIIIPLLRLIVEDKQLLVYYLVLSFIFVFVIPEIIKLIKDFTPQACSSLMAYVDITVGRLNVRFLSVYVFYFLLGYYLCVVELCKRSRIVIYGLGIIGFISTFTLNWLYAWKTAYTYERYFDSHTVNVALEAISIFIALKYLRFDKVRLNKVICVMSKCSLGAYWTHVFFRDALFMSGYDALTFNPWLTVPIISFVVLFISFFASYILNHIPYVNKWLV